MGFGVLFFHLLAKPLDESFDVLGLGRDLCPITFLFGHEKYVAVVLEDLKSSQCFIRFKQGFGLLKCQ